MCATCGCSEHHDHDHDHDHDTRTLRIEEAVLQKNDHIAGHNREWLARRELVAVNFMSSPGAGKTTLLEGLIAGKSLAERVFVIQGDQATDRDAARIRAVGARAVQINTKTGCHLDAQMVAGALRELDPPPKSFVVIENVGNLVCPALFDLGERARVVVASTPEGADKPYKYPYLFRGADLVVLNKIDLLPYVSFDVDAFEAVCKQLAPRAPHVRASATRGDGIDELWSWMGSL